MIKLEQLDPVNRNSFIWSEKRLAYYGVHLSQSSNALDSIDILP